MEVRGLGATLQFWPWEMLDWETSWLTPLRASLKLLELGGMFPGTWLIARLLNVFPCCPSSYAPRFYFTKLSLSLSFSCQILLEYGRKGIVEPARQRINWAYVTFLLFKQFFMRVYFDRCSIRYGLHYRTMTYTCLELAVKYDQMAFLFVYVTGF